MRSELVDQAITFLGDEKVRASPLAKQISFLEGKGLTAEEIQEALDRARGKGSDRAPTLPARPKTRNIPLLVFLGASGVCLVYLAQKFWSRFTEWAGLGEPQSLKTEIEKVEASIKSLRLEHESVRSEMIAQARALGVLIERADKDLERWRSEEGRAKEEMAAIAASLKLLNDALPQVQVSRSP